MNKKRLIFYSIFGAFHLFLVIFTFYVESQKDDFNFLFKILGWMNIMKWGAVLGLLLVIIDVIWSWIFNHDSQKEKAALTHELNTLKAKLFDLQEAAGKASMPPSSKN